MITTHNLGFPRIGAKRELKFAVEKYWRGKLTESELQRLVTTLRQKHWQQQDNIDWIPVGDFSFYDQVLDASFILGNVPTRTNIDLHTELDAYFRVARGRSVGDTEASSIAASEMTKWFDTNYHYLVPEFSSTTEFKLQADRLLAQIDEALQLRDTIKPVIIGPLTYLWLGKSLDRTQPLDLLNKILPVYNELLELLFKRGIQWVQIDEPILATDLSAEWCEAFKNTYSRFSKNRPRILLASYFGQLRENLDWACELPVDGLHLDVSVSNSDVAQAIELLPADMILSLGVISGRNVWKSDLNTLLDWLEPIASRLQSRLWIAPSCSLLHVPVDLSNEEKIDREIAPWLAFAVQKLDELNILATALNDGRQAVADKLKDNAEAIAARTNSPRTRNLDVQQRVKDISADDTQRQSPFPARSIEQRQKLNLPIFPTTTIGSFPQTDEIRRTRRQFKSGNMPEPDYLKKMRSEIADCIKRQEQLGLDVLVHGEAERNDMVEYFGEQLIGCTFTEYGWVQSYGSRCVKPPIIYGDISRRQAMTVGWTEYAQSLTDKPVKGMLTGPVTILNWSFVRDDQPRQTTCAQLALAIRDEVLDLERVGINIIQIDEPAIREGLPLRHRDASAYLEWAIGCFRLAANGVRDETQIHTHMCYSEFNEIIQSITEMDADVITIEASRSNMELVNAFVDFEYPNDIGPGVYDIHSPNIPSTDQMVDRLQMVSEHLPQERLWVNPDCGLKTRKWDEVSPAIENMVTAASILRNLVAVN